MADIDMSGIKAYSFPDKTTWVGRFDENKRTLAGVIIFNTPTTSDFEEDVGFSRSMSFYVETDHYLKNMYKAKIRVREGHNVKSELPTAENFDPSKAIAEWDLSK